MLPMRKRKQRNRNSNAHQLSRSRSSMHQFKHSESMPIRNINGRCRIRGKRKVSKGRISVSSPCKNGSKVKSYLQPKSQSLILVSIRVTPTSQGKSGWILAMISSMAIRAPGMITDMARMSRGSLQLEEITHTE